MDIKKYEHLRLVPTKLMSAPDFITKVLHTVIKHKNKIHYRDASKEFMRATGFRLNDFFDFDEGDMKVPRIEVEHFCHRQGGVRKCVRL